MRNDTVWQEIQTYLQQQYTPLAVIVYGSYADGTNCEDSDFDALVITDTTPYCHDTAQVAGVTLDVFVYPKHSFDDTFDCDAFPQIADGTILFDTEGLAHRVQNEVAAYLHAQTKKSAEEVQDEIAWCRKMLRRAARDDAEGLFRRHWLLTDSLEIFCDTVCRRYTGPKKTLLWMQQDYPQAYQLYHTALTDIDLSGLEHWIAFLDQIAAEIETGCRSA